jgi:hypothetical protein
MHLQQRVRHQEGTQSRRASDAQPHILNEHMRQLATRALATHCERKFLEKIVSKLRVTEQKRFRQILQAQFARATTNLQSSF